MNRPGKTMIVLLLVALFAYVNADSNQPNRIPQMLSFCTLKIKLDLIPIRLEEWDSDYSIDFTQKIKRGNLPEEFVIAIDGDLARKEQVDNQLGWLGNSVEFYNQQTSQNYYGKEHQYVKVCYPIIPEWAVDEEEEEELDEPQVEMLNEFKEVLGYKCQKAVWSREDGEGWEVWFTSELSLPGKWLPLWGKEGIPGLIVEMTELTSRHQVSAKHYSLVEVNLERPDPAGFSPSDAFLKFSEASEARSAIGGQIEKAFATGDSGSKKVQGYWKLNSPEDEIFAEVKGSENEYLFVEYLSSGSQVVKRILIGEDRFRFAEVGNFEQYALNVKGLLTRLDHSAFTFRRITAKEFQKGTGKK